MERMHCDVRANRARAARRGSRGAISSSVHSPFEGCQRGFTIGLAVARVAGCCYLWRDVDWLEHDGVRPDSLPAWARDGEVVGGVELHRDGVVLSEGSDRAALPWSQILAVTRVDGALYVCAARRPPRPPWFVVADDVAAGRIERALEERRGARESYRGAAPERREALSPDEVRRRVLLREDLPGAIEVPLGIPKPKALHHALIGAVFGGGFGLQIGAEAESWPVAAVAALMTTAAFGGGMHFALWRRWSKRPRVLVMTPDAFVAGLDGGQVRAHPWSAIVGFRRGVHFGKDALAVIDGDGSLLARVEARLFGVPLDLLIALAEAYRERVGSER